MKESDVEEASVKLLNDFCPGAVIYKHADRWTAGIPDRSITWRGFDSWLEYKLWEPNGTFHDEFALKESGRANVQLLELIKLERQTGRAWVIAYRRGNPRTSQLERLEIYQPSRWVDKAGFVLRAPVELRHCALENVAWAARVNGYAMFPTHDHRAVVSLIHLTHRREYESR